LPAAKKLAAWLEEHDFTISYKWWNEEILPKPFRGNNNPKLHVIMKNELISAAGADIFVLFSAPGMRGAYIELGAFLADADTSNKTVYVIGGAQEEHSFESLSHFVFVDSVDELKQELNNG